MTAMHLRWSFRPFEGAAPAQQTDPGPPSISGRTVPSRFEGSWLAVAADPRVLRGAFGFGGAQGSKA
jgi:hypothetical protein